MSIPSREEFWGYMSRFGRMAGQLHVEFAVVQEVLNTGKVILRIAGESQPSQKHFICFKSYIPEKGDWVMLIKNIVIGGWKPDA